MTAETSNARGEWVLVPRELTQGMRSALARAVNASCNTDEWYAHTLAAAPQPPSAPVGVELSALRVQEWLQREYDILPPVQEIEQAMRTPCSCPFTERALAQQPAAEEQLTYKGVPIGPMQTFADMERQASAPVGVDAPGSRSWMAEVCRAAALSLAAHGVRNDQLSKVADWIAQQPAAADGAYPTPRNRAEAVALARLVLAHLGVIDAHIDAAIARCETNSAAQPGGSDNDR